jgi:GNAT superfamily N-acetyltransferase
MRHPSEFNIVRAGPANFGDANALLHEYYEAIGVLHRDTEFAVRSFLELADAGMWIAYDGDQPIGCVVLRPLLAEDSAAECKRLYVRSGYRRRGVAAALMNELEAFARLSGIGWIYLDTKDDLEPAIALYMGRGYQPCERYNDNAQATIFLRKQLTP